MRYGNYVLLVIGLILGHLLVRSCTQQNNVAPSVPAYAPCNYATGYDSLGRICGGRSAEVRPGGALGGNGSYIDPFGRPRIYGSCNDDYDGC
jgi:hypothetical protein